MFNKKLKKAMQDLGLSQAQLSKMTGIGRSSISQYISGKNVLTEARQAEIVAALGLAEDYFTSDEVIAVPLLKESGGAIPRLTLTDTAKLMGMSKLSVANGLQEGIFPWGYAVKGRGEKFVYFINAKRFVEIEGIAI